MICVIHRAFSSKNFIQELLSLLTLTCSHDAREEGKDGAERTSARSGKITPPHQFYQGLALAPVLCFLEPWHFYLPAHREGGANVKISCQEMQCLQCWCCDYVLLAVIIWQHFFVTVIYSCRLEYC